MEYFSILNLQREPFSNSPDPAYFFQSGQHLGCLQKLELSLRLRRGLNVVIGDVGTGKTTLCRQLIRRFDDDQTCETYLILDPYFSTPIEFLTTVARLLDVDDGLLSGRNQWQLKEAIKQRIFQKGVDEAKTIVLIIDEGQKLPEFCLEILREFLNFETNEYKLLQIVIFAQKEFEEILKTHANVADRINLHHLLEPLNFTETRQMILFRLDQSRSGAVKRSFFTFPAMWTIYRLTGGYPRKIVNLCHRVMLAMIIQNRTRAGRRLVRSCARRVAEASSVRWRRVLTAVFAVMLLALAAIGFAPEYIESFWSPGPKAAREMNVLSDTGTGKAARIPMPEARSGGELPSDRSDRSRSSDRDDPERSPTDKKMARANLVPASAAKPAALAPDAPRRDAATLPATVSVPASPEFLGRVTLKPNETLWRLIEKVYGAYDDKYFRAIKHVNPQIRDPKRIEAGSVITVPALPVTPRRVAGDVRWIRIGEKRRLAAAVQALRDYPDNAPPIRLIPYWNRNGLRFAILLDARFDGDQAVNDRIGSLPQDLAARVTVLSSWDADTVFYADPYRPIRR